MSSRYGFPKERRILKSAEYRLVYQKGLKIPSPFFVAFCLREDGGGEARVGFTAPRALGNAVVRNRIKRRMRECCRLSLSLLPAGWRVVFNPRRAVLQAPFDRLAAEVGKVFERCATR